MSASVTTAIGTGETRQAALAATRRILEASGLPYQGARAAESIVNEAHSNGLAIRGKEALKCIGAAYIYATIYGTQATFNFKEAAKALHDIYGGYREIRDAEISIKTSAIELACHTKQPMVVMEELGLTYHGELMRSVKKMFSVPETPPQVRPDLKEIINFTAAERESAEKEKAKEAAFQRIRRGLLR